MSGERIYETLNLGNERTMGFIRGVLQRALPDSKFKDYVPLNVFKLENGSEGLITTSYVN